MIPDTETKAQPSKQQSLIFDLNDEQILVNMPELFRHELSIDSHGPRVVVFANAKGGVGKTTLAYEFARHLKNEEIKVLMIDLDYQCNLSAYALQDGGRLPNVLTRERQSTIYHHFYGFPQDPQKAAESDKLFRPLCQTYYGEIPLLHGHPDVIDLEASMATWTPSVMRYMVIPALIALNQRIKDYDAIVIDTPPGLSRHTIGAILTANVVVFPLNPDLLSILGVVNIYNKMRKVTDAIRAMAVNEKQLKYLKRFSRPKMMPVMNLIRHGGARGVADNVNDIIDNARRVFKTQWPEMNDEQGKVVWNGTLRLINLAVNARAQRCSAFDIHDAGAHQAGAKAYKDELGYFCQHLKRMLGD